MFQGFKKKFFKLRPSILESLTIRGFWNYDIQERLRFSFVKASVILKNLRSVQRELLGSGIEGFLRQSLCRFTGSGNIGDLLSNAHLEF